MEKPAATFGEDTRVPGTFLRGVMANTVHSRNFRVLSPDKNNSNQMGAILEATGRYLIHRLTYKRTNHDIIQIHGFQGEGTTTTPFDRMIINNLDHFHLASRVSRHFVCLCHRTDAHGCGARRGGHAPLSVA